MFLCANYVQFRQVFTNAHSVKADPMTRGSKELGNSAVVVERHYKQLTGPQIAAEWSAIRPTDDRVCIPDQFTDFMRPMNTNFEVVIIVFSSRSLTIRHLAQTPLNMSRHNTIDVLRPAVINPQHRLR